MVRQTFVFLTGRTNPYRNIALEALLLEKVPQESCILYLWQNRRTVVIGRNQNAWKECRVQELEASGGYLARRLSGGGAVFHDLGNLNFTFLVPQAEYSLDTQTDVILRAVQRLGINAVKTGRNDIETDGRKFSGNAYYRSGKNAYHHGTLLVNADKEAAARYLSVSQDKIRSKGVESVKSRIVNLAECNPAISITALIESLRAAFDEVYGIKARELRLENIFTEFFGAGKDRLAELEAQFADPTWKYGKNPPFTFETASRFIWGGVEIGLDVHYNTIREARIFSDAMDGDFIPELADLMKGTPFNREALSGKIAAAYKDDPLRREYATDIIKLIFDESEKIG
ncbi:lipoate-protein ligase A (Lipoate--protein ligase) [Treponema primitia ZAS-2]|uniref:lipoate--protein ligase n=1 Tax=Treponema primitia (strain ATCC BAA-887 / DSM 12427 / ZAS-2) TaxID=545694 RepID=F5YPL0_TREPZ|nr:lipoate--protein ligase [Treponema primitia]AEF86441.1 lipoate-protein ligase A (Lipoate--protein ligase) [Treponema primitia ZAS-2]